MGFAANRGYRGLIRGGDVRGIVQGGVISVVGTGGCGCFYVLLFVSLTLLLLCTLVQVV